MFLDLAKLQQIDPTATQDEIDAWEQLVRAETNNHFQIVPARVTGIEVLTEKKIGIDQPAPFFRKGDTIELWGTGYNDGVQEIETVSNSGGIELRMRGAGLIPGNFPDAIATLVRYPADIEQGILKLAEWDRDYGDKRGIKSETISRMSLTYADINSAETIQGYPKALFDFLSPYRVIKWGD